MIFQSKGFVTSDDIIGKKSIEPHESQHLPFVTSEMQQRYIMGKRGETKIKIQDIIQDESLRAKFAKDEFPKFTVTNDNKIFFQPKIRVRSPITTKFIKWLMLDNNLEVSHDHDYDFVELNPNGYLMKIALTPTSMRIKDFQIQYVCNLQDIEFETIMEQGQNKLSPDYFTENPVQKLTVSPFNPNEYPKIARILLEPDNFIEKYLQNVIE